MSISGRQLLYAATGMVSLLAASLLVLRRDHGHAPAGEPSAGERIASGGRERSRRAPVPERWMPLLDRDLPRAERLALASTIGPGLPPQDVDFLFASLSHRPPAGEEEQWWSVLNEIMERMRKHGLGAERYSEILSSLILDSSQPDVVKDYAIQHLSQWLAPAAGGNAPGEGDTGRKQAALSAIARAIQNPGLAGGSVPGTGLMALADATPRLQPELSRQVWDGLQPFVLDTISGTGTASTATRVSAIQAVSLLDDPSYLPTIRKLASSDDADPSVKLSSIAALGVYGEEADRASLDFISKSGGRYRFAAAEALKKLHSP